MTNIALPSAQSLLIEMRANGHSLAVGTAFVVDARTGPALITNWHNLAGRRPDTKQPMSPTGGLPDEVRILHNAKDRLGSWIWRSETLYSSGRPRWREHPTHAEKVDVVALPLTDLTGVQLYPHLLEGGAKICVGPADPVSVIGFPFGLTAGGALAVWATGFLASEPEVNFNDLPLQLVDCRTRRGQSGSAVIAYRGGGAVPMADGGTAIFQGPVWRFLGCYSGRVNEESDLGLVWKASAVGEVANA